MKIPPDAKVIEDSRLTLVRAVCTLHDKHVKGDGGLSDQIKATMTAKTADYAESDFVIARLAAGKEKAEIDAHQAFIRCTAKKGVGVKKFLECCSVNKAAILKLLSENEVEQITKFGEAGKPILTTEFKPSFEIDPKEMFAFLGDRLVKTLHRSARA